VDTPKTFSHQELHLTETYLERGIFGSLPNFVNKISLPRQLHHFFQMTLTRKDLEFLGKTRNGFARPTDRDQDCR
jgi:hypothetical protein